MTSAALPVLEPIEQPSRAELLLHPLRQRILSEAQEPATAAEIARRVGLPAQKVNYHVRTLADAGLLRPAGEGRKRNLVEKRYQASARSYVLLPRVLGAMSATNAPTEEADRFSAAHLLQLSARLQEEVGQCLDAASEGEERVSTLSLEAELRFVSAEQRAEFAQALQQAVSGVIGRYTAPAHDTAGRARPGRPYRLIVGCHPVPGPTRDPDEPIDEETPT